MNNIPIAVLDLILTHLNYYLYLVGIYGHKRRKILFFLAKVFRFIETLHKFYFIAERDEITK